VLEITNANGYTLSTDPARLDTGRVHAWLSTDAYWALGRSRQVVERGFGASLSFGVYRPDGVQVAVARAVTDSATFAWLCDVYVDPTERGHGLGTWMVGAVRDELATRGVRRILLATADAQGVYAKLGFVPLADTDRWMELRPR
jgi:GNAT superfamily N-acetyltransferase